MADPRCTQGQRGEGIGHIVPPDQAHLADGQKRLKAVTEIFLALDPAQAKASQLRLPHAPTDNFHLRATSGMVRGSSRLTTALLQPRKIRCLAWW